jgi:N-acetylmuramoyl-L-alanine amidase
MSKIRRIVVHCSDSQFGNSSLITRWHIVDRGWYMNGYHRIILNGWFTPTVYDDRFDGWVETGRPLGGDDAYLSGVEIGAHVLGYNSDSIGVCLIGKNGVFSPEQFDALEDELIDLLITYGDLEIVGHCDLDKDKPYCPGFNVKEFVKNRNIKSLNI